MFRPDVKAIKQVVQDVVEDALKSATSGLREIKTLVQLQEEVNRLKIDKSKLEEDNGRKIREAEHKIGLEKMRQDVELTQAKREAVLTVKEENLKADQDRFTEQISFHEKRFTEEVGYLKDMVSQVLERVPNVDIGVGGRVKSRQKDE